MKTFVVSAVSASAVHKAGVINTKCAGLPFSIVTTPNGIRAFIAICPHDWIVMRNAAVDNNCLVCPLHLATFSVCSGEVVNSRGKRIREGLREAATEINKGQVLVHLDMGHYFYFAGAQARRAMHTRKRLRGAIVRLLTGGLR